MTWDDFDRERQERRRRGLERFPPRLIEASGETALATREALEAAGEGSPAVLGDYARNPDDFDNPLAPLS